MNGHHEEKKLVCLPKIICSISPGAFWGRGKAKIPAAIMFLTSVKDSFFEVLELKTIVKQERKSSYAEMTKVI